MVSANTGPKSDRTITRVQQVREIFFMLILQRTFQSRGLARVDCFCKRERQQQFSDALEPRKVVAKEQAVAPEILTAHSLSCCRSGPLKAGNSNHISPE